MVGKLSKCMNDSVEIICIKSENFTENFIDEKDFFFFLARNVLMMSLTLWYNIGQIWN